MNALLDGDSWVYRCGFAAEKTFYLAEWEGHYTKWESYREAKTEVPEGVLWSRKEVEPLENCLQMVKTSLENTLHVLGTKDFRLYLSGRRSFRDELFPDYKANRDGSAKPKYYRDIRDYLVGKWRAEVVDAVEADDAVGIAATELGPSAVIVAVDKDLNQIPGSHYNWTTGETFSVTPQMGMKFFYQQMLSGDPTDNIEGIKGIGPVKAEKALSDARNPRECAERVWKMYAEAFGDGATRLLEQNAQLLWIWRKRNDQHPFWRHLEMQPPR